MLSRNPPRNARKLPPQFTQQRDAGRSSRLPVLPSGGGRDFGEPLSRVDLADPPGVHVEISSDAVQELTPKDAALDDRGVVRREIAGRIAGAAMRPATISHGNEAIASDIIKLFRLSVTATAALTILLCIADYYAMIHYGLKASDRLVTERVLMAIIGSSVVQLGAATIAIVYSLFGKPKGEIGAD